MFSPSAFYQGLLFQTNFRVLCILVFIFIIFTCYVLKNACFSKSQHGIWKEFCLIIGSVAFIFIYMLLYMSPEKGTSTKTMIEHFFEYKVCLVLFQNKLIFTQIIVATSPQSRSNKYRSLIMFLWIFELISGM